MKRTAGVILIALIWTVDIAVIAYGIRFAYELRTKEGRYFE